MLGIESTLRGTFPAAIVLRYLMYLLSCKLEYNPVDSVHKIRG